MAKIGAQKLYSVAREGNSALLLFLLQCPESLSNYSQDRLLAEIESAPEELREGCYVAAVKALNHPDAKELLTEKLYRMYRAHDPDELRGALTHALVLYETELPGVAPHSATNLVMRASWTRDLNLLLRTVALAYRGSGNLISTEDDVVHWLFTNWCQPLNGGDPREWKDKDEYKRQVLALLCYGTESLGLPNVWGDMVTRLANQGCGDAVAHVLEHRLEYSPFDADQRGILKLATPEQRKRLLGLTV